MCMCDIGNGAIEGHKLKHIGHIAWGQAAGQDDGVSEDPAARSENHRY
jgi:hypothetical protein